jgi:hypothetical protein
MDPEEALRVIQRLAKASRIEDGLLIITVY